MSVLQQVLSDARRLATRLRDHDTSADNLLTQAQGMFKQVESMKEYCEEMNQLNEVANNRPRGALIHSIQQENRYIRELQEENKELRLALEEQQNVMELIMSKYREQVAKLLSSGPDPHSADNTAMQRKLGANIERVSEMVCVMRRAAQLDEDQSHHFQQLVTALVRENKGLREMLHIAIHSGSVASPDRLDVDTQTDPSTASDTDTIKLNPNFSSSASSAAGDTGASSLRQTASPPRQAPPAAADEPPVSPECGDAPNTRQAPPAAAAEPLVSPERGDASTTVLASPPRQTPPGGAAGPPVSPEGEDVPNTTVLASESEQSSSDDVLLNNNQSEEDDEGRGGPPDEAATS